MPTNPSIRVMRIERTPTPQNGDAFTVAYEIRSDIFGATHVQPLIVMVSSPTTDFENAKRQADRNLRGVFVALADAMKE